MSVDLVYQDVTNLFRVAVQAVPQGTGAGDPIPLKCTSKSLPSIPESQTWSVVTDDPDEDVGITEVGKTESMSQLEYEVLYSFAMFARLTELKAAGTKFNIVHTHDNQAYAKVEVITVSDCFLVSATNSSSDNAGTAALTVVFQPRGGGKITDHITITQTERT